ncbi:MAG: [protein-PII] uridylyltransferase, partial [Ignavibacteria bacterium]|nr:[protein-PII] uridylyltransferase [Ignavibacteria bacterium]
MDIEPLKIKEKFIQARNQIFQDEELLKDSLQFSIKYSLLVEEYVQTVLKGKKLDFAIASVGSFSRRELSPFSDIDMMFISEKVKNDEKLIKECVTMLWDAGIEASHTVR